MYTPRCYVGQKKLNAAVDTYQKSSSSDMPPINVEWKVRLYFANHHEMYIILVFQDMIQHISSFTIIMNSHT